MAEEAKSEPSHVKRRVYELPIELVERINSFQRERGLPSEVEAVRKLLDTALKEQDTLEAIVWQAANHLDTHRDPSETARAILAGHPKVAAIYFEDDAVRFDFQDRNKAEEIRIFSSKNIHVFSDPGTTFEAKLISGRAYLSDVNEIPF